MSYENVKTEIIYGDWDGTPQKGCFVEVRTWDDNNHICIDLANDGRHTVWNFDMKGMKVKTAYAIKDEIEDLCDEIDELGGFDICIQEVEERMSELFDKMYDKWFED